MDIRTRPAAAPSVCPQVVPDGGDCSYLRMAWQLRPPPSSNSRGIASFPKVSDPGSPYIHIYDMDICMKTTLNIDDTVMAELKREAARQGRTMSELVETALRLLLISQRKRGRLPALPKFRSGGALVDVADRDALYHAVEGR